MGYGNGMRWLTTPTLICLAVLWMGTTATALELAIVARFSPEQGLISDAAIFGDWRLALLYPEQGRIADYSLNGLLNQHITRESGEGTRFIPTTCATGLFSTLAVFDEASSALFTIAPDGNITKGIALAYPTGPGSATALSRIGDLEVDGNGSIWVLLPDRGILAQFDGNGGYLGEQNLRQALGNKLALPSRFQFQPGGSLSFLDYHQGAVFIKAADGGFQRIALAQSDVFDAVPSVQDYAVDQAGNILLATHDVEHPLVLLVPENGEMVAHQLSVDFPSGARRLACRYSAGKFIVWSREEPFLIVIELSL